MKSYQDPDPLHGNGKAIPKPKRPNKNTQGHFVNRYVRHPDQWGLQKVDVVALTRNGDHKTPFRINPRQGGL